MTAATFLALAVAATAPKPPPAYAFLKASAGAAPSCRTTPVDGQVVRASLFSPESERCPVAIVGDEPLALRDLAAVVEVGHLTRPSRAARGEAPEMDLKPALERLITARLLIQEAREMGLDSTPDVRKAVEDFKASRLRSMLQDVAARGLKPDAAEVERLYRDAVREWKIKSVLLEKEADAKAFEAALEGGQGFDALAKKFVAEKKAKGGGKAEFVPPKRMLPEVRAVVEKAKPGVPTGLVRIPKGWIVLCVDGMRYPANDPAARRQAREISLARLRHEAVRRFYVALVEKYAKVDEALLKSLDFEAGGEKGFAALLEDKRPVATIAGEKPITVGDLGREISMKFFHGLESPIQQRRVNREKDAAFEKLLGTRLFAKEAALRKLEQRPELLLAVEEYERSVAFDVFVQKVLAPEVKVSEQEGLDYYEAHEADFTAPRMVRLDGIAFPTVADAQAALDKVKGGTDFSWLRSTAPGQIAPQKRSLELEGRTLSATGLPPELGKALTGATAGTYRLFAAREDEVWVIRVVEETPPATRPYAEVREEILKKLVADRLMAVMRDYADKLRKVRRVDVLVTRVSL